MYRRFHNSALTHLGSASLYLLWSLVAICENPTLPTGVLPDSQQMTTLKPESRERLQAFDRLFQTLGQDAELVQGEYASAARLKDLLNRLLRVRASGNALDVYTAP